MEFVYLLGIVILGCLFPNYLVEAIRAGDEAHATARRQRAGVTFGGLMFLLCLYIGSV